MKALAAVLIAALAVSCSPSPTAPSLSPDVTASMESAAKPDHTPGTYKATLYFYSPALPLGGGVHLVNVPVYVWTGTVRPSQPLLTGKQGGIDIDIPKTATSLNYQMPPYAYHSALWSGCVWTPMGTVPIPYGVRENWIYVRTDCAF